MFVLRRKLNCAGAFESGRVWQLDFPLRRVLLATWPFYPVVHAPPLCGVEAVPFLTVLQEGTSAAGPLNKVGIVLLLRAIAREKRDEHRALAKVRKEKAQSQADALQAGD